MKTRVLLILLAACVATCGADRTVACTAHAAAGLGVAVTNAATGQPICDANVTAVEGTYSERLFEVSCSFTGAYERPGVYVIRATRAGFLPYEVGSVRVVMGGGQCPHVEQTRVTVSLTPTG
jgi:hypothetical protein